MSLPPTRPAIACGSGRPSASNSPPPEWNHTLVLFLTEQLDFTQLFSEPSVFFKGAGDNFITISYTSMIKRSSRALSLPSLLSS